MEEKVRTIIADVLNVTLDKVTLDTEIGELPEWDSLNNVRIITELESKFSVKLEPELLMDLEDVSDIVELIEEMAHE